MQFYSLDKVEGIELSKKAMGMFSDFPMTKLKNTLSVLFNFLVLKKDA